MKVAILGCGPAGLLAAHAAEYRGHEVNIFSRKQKSELGGAQYLHQRILGLPQNGGETLSIRHIGGPKGYAHKVYGDFDARTSWTTYPSGNYDIWNMRDAYDFLWEKYEDAVNDWDFMPPHKSNMIDEVSRNHDRVVSSMPAKALCQAGHHYFGMETVLIAYDHEENLPGAPYLEQNTVLYSGDHRDTWYRSSNLFGLRSTEYPQGAIGPDVPTGLKTIHKPLETDCDCHPGIIRVGRYGEWKKGILSHDAFNKVLDLL